jgi:hypothetical protein
MIEECSKMVKRIMVTLDDEQHRTLRGLAGFGTKDAERIRNMLAAYISEKSYLKKEKEKKE